MFTDSDYTAYNHKGNKNPVNGVYSHIFIHKIIEKLNEGKDVSLIFCGPKGNGKSMGALKLAEIVQEDMNVFEGDFDPERNLIYDTLQYLEILDEIHLPDYDEREDDINPEREVLIVDESGVQLNKSDYATEMNDAFGDMIQIQRKANCLVIYCLPVAGDLDVRIKRDIDFVVEFIGIGVAKVTGYTYQHGRLDKDVRMYVDFNQQELLLNPALKLGKDRGFWKPDLPGEDKIEVYTEKENEYKESVPTKLIEIIKKKRREDQDDGGSRFDEILNEE